MKTALAAVAIWGVMALLAQAQVPGGWSKASVKDQGVVDAAKFAIKAQQAALAKGGSNDKLELTEITAAQQQVVQGMNYRLSLKVKLGNDTKNAEATVWARVWLKGDDQYKLTDWKFTDK